MELTFGAPHLSLLFGIVVVLILCGIGYGAYLGWNAAIRKFGRNAADMQRQFDRLDEVAQRDPARMGIDIGKQYAADKMRRTIEQIEAETD